VKVKSSKKSAEDFAMENEPRNLTIGTLISVARGQGRLQYSRYRVLYAIYEHLKTISFRMRSGAVETL